MIGKLSGRIDYRGSDHILLDVRGVGYIVYVSDRVMHSLPANGEAVALYTDLVVREDLLQLFGFLTLVEKEWHRLLMSVQGVGAKASLAILGTLGPEGVSRAIALGDWSAISKAKGIGPKTAQRVVLDLKSKAPSVMAMSGQEAELIEPVEPLTPVAAPGAKPRAAKKSAPSVVPDVLSALSNLGYPPSDAASAVAEAHALAPEAGVQELIRAALKLLAPK